MPKWFSSNNKQLLFTLAHILCYSPSYQYDKNKYNIRELLKLTQDPKISTFRADPLFMAMVLTDARDILDGNKALAVIRLDEFYPFDKCVQKTRDVLSGDHFDLAADINLIGLVYLKLINDKLALSEQAQLLMEYCFKVIPYPYDWDGHVPGMERYHLEKLYSPAATRLITDCSGYSFMVPELAKMPDVEQYVYDACESKKDAELVSVVAGTLASLCGKEYDPSLYKELSELVDQSDQKDETIKSLERKVEQEIIARKDAESKISKLQRELRIASYHKSDSSKDYEEEIAKLREENSSLLAQINDLLQPVEEEDMEDGDIQFPYYLNKRVVLYGGFDSFQARLQELLPGLVVIPPTRTGLAETRIRSADYLCYQRNCCSHGQGGRVLAVARAHSIPVIFLGSAGPEACARAIIQRCNT